MTPELVIPSPLADAGQALRQVLLRLDNYAKKRVQHLDTAAPHAAAVLAHVQDLDALMSAVQEYEEAALACLFTNPAPNQPDIHQLSRAELLAYRQADPVYRLGFVRGYKRGAAHTVQDPEQVRAVFVAHAGLPAAPSYASLTERVVRFLAMLPEGYGKPPRATSPCITPGHGTH